MDRISAYPKGLWTGVPGTNRPHGVRCGDIIWVGGQVDLDAAGRVQHPYDLWTQLTAVMQNVGRVLVELSAKPEDLIKLSCLYVSDGGADEQRVISAIQAQLPNVHVALTAIPVPYLACRGLSVQIEGYAMQGKNGDPLPRTCVPGISVASKFRRSAQGVRCGKMIFVGGQSPVDARGCVLYPGDIVAQTRLIMDRIGSVLEHLGSSLDDAVKLNRWYVGHGTVADWRPAALACADYFREPGPAATGMPLPMLGSPGQQIMIEVVAMRGEDGRRLPRRHSWPKSLWDWPLHLPYKHGLKCAEMIFLGGQVSLDKRGGVVNAGDLLAQADVAMTHIGTILRDLGADYRDICKLTMMYESDCSPERLAGLSSVCSSFFTDQCPTATAIALPTLSYPQMVVEIDTFAMIEPALESQ